MDTVQTCLRQGPRLRLARAMSAYRTPAWTTQPPRAPEATEAMRESGLDPRTWSNGPGDRYGWHEHSYHKVLRCAAGSITFHTPEGEFELAAGDQLDIEPGTAHAATVGPDGVTCVEAAR